MRARWMWKGATVAVVAVWLGGCNAEPGLAASFDYALSARFKVPDLQPPEEQGEYEVYADGPLHRDDWLVELDACDSPGSPVKYSWRVDGMAVGEFTRCDEFEYEFPGEGTYSVSLVVEDSAGEEVEQTSDVVVRDLLIFGVGDSYASGEGNPDVNASDEDGVQWQSQRCHRSEYSGQVRAAQMIEDADRHSSVTFVHLPCSGGRIHKALLGPYEGIEPIEDGPDVRPQIEHVAELAGEHQIDALFVSIGGNDINFANVVEACILGEPCHLGDPMADPLFFGAASRVCGLAGSAEAECLAYLDREAIDPETLDAQHIFDIHSKTEDCIESETEDCVDGEDPRQDGIDDLPDNYDDLAEEIVSLLDVNPGQVYLAEIPDVTRDEQGQTCGWPTETPGPSELLRAAIQELPGVTQPEMEWAREHVLTQLRDAMRASADEHGWQFVEGVDSRFVGHGYCAAEPWVVRLQNTFQIQGDKNGALHPNLPGHGAYAAALFDAFDLAQ